MSEDDLMHELWAVAQSPGAVEETVAIMQKVYDDHILGPKGKMVKGSFDEKALEVARLIEMEIYQKPATAKEPTQ